MAITPNQIRTGNSFQYFISEDGCEWDTKKLDWQDIKWCEDENENFNKVHKPIPLTEDWLLKFGFKREDKAPSKEHSQYFSKWVMDYKYSFAFAPFREDWGFYHSYTDAGKEEENNRFDFISCGIKYVHQLENLYFALTGIEADDIQWEGCVTLVTAKGNDTPNTPTEPLPAEGSAKGVRVELTEDDIKWLHQKPVAV